MSPTETLFIAGVAAAGMMIIYFLANAKQPGSWMLAAFLCAAFTAYTGATIATEGPIGFLANHTTNHWGVQVWYDLIISLGIALFLILPRAQIAGMAATPWLIFVALTASIGLLAMIARLLWLEARSAKAD